MRNFESSQSTDTLSRGIDVFEPESSQLSRSGSKPTCFLAGGEGVGALMRAHDWSTSTLGPPADWPSALKNIVALVLNSKFPMFVAWGAELAFLYNDAYLPILQDKHPSALGRPFAQVWSDVWPEIEPIVRRSLAGQSDYYADQPFTLHRNGLSKQAWFTFSYSPVRDDAGQVAGVYCACSETTGQFLAQRDQQAEYLRFRSLFQQAPGLVAIMRGPNHAFEFANDAYQRLVGQRDLIGMSVAKALPEVAAQGFIKLLDSVYLTGEPYIGSGVSVSLKRSADSPMEERFVDFIFQPIRNEQGQISGIFVEGSDVTDRVLADNALREEKRHKDEFLAMLAHELRNPLAPISTAAEILKRPGISTEAVRRSGDIVARQVAHMTGLVNDLLDVSRVTRGLVTIGDELVDLPGVIDESVEQTQSAIRQKNLHFSAHLAPGPLFVRGNRTRLVQVFSNILHNAAKFTETNGHVSIALRTTGGQIEVVVADDGVGITPELLPHLFELFSQAQRTPDRSQGGLGLGLCLVKGLVSLHKGTVYARSAGTGRGSEFVVLLPRVEAGAPEAVHSPAAEHAASTTQLILEVVDDNVDAAETLGDLLRMMGHQVSIAYTGTAGLELARANSPGLLFLDIGLPDMDGYELVRRMRLLPQTAASTIVAVTGYGKQADIDRALQAGFDRHIVKPLSFDELASVISEHTSCGGPETTPPRLQSRR